MTYKYRKGFAPSQQKICDVIKASHKLTDRVAFGKHRSETWEAVIFNDPEYIQWAFDSIPGFDLDEEAKQVWRNRMLAIEQEETEG